MLAYSLETFPGLYWNQSTFPPPTFHSEPNAVSNSACVSPGGRRLTRSFNRGAAGFGAFFGGAEAFF